MTPSHYQRAIDSFQFLIKEYPGERKYREGAQLAVAHIQQDDLHRRGSRAVETYEQFLAQHPRSSHAAEACAPCCKSGPRKISAAKAPQTASAPPPASLPRDRADSSTRRGRSPADKSAPTTDTKPGASDDSSDTDASSPQVSRIRTWNADTYTRVVIDVGTKVKYQAARISGPDRIYFDIDGSKLSSALLHKPIDLDGSGFLKTIRVAQNQSGVVRVVLEVNRVTDYSVFLLPDPYRLVVDVYGTSAAAEAAARNTSPSPGPTTTDAPPAKAEKIAKESPARASTSKEAANKETTKASAKSSSETDSDAADDENPDAEFAPRKTSSASAKNATKSAAAETARINKAKDGEATSKTTVAENETPSADILPLPAHPKWPKKSSRSAKSAHDQAEEMGPPPIPDLTLDGQHSLTRALGLKIGRIVIDAGHGGHDTGTIGPTGLMEKDLCLDVALRLGKIIQLKLPSAEVVFTRNDDTFISAGVRRTEIANEAQAPTCSYPCMPIPARTARRAESKPIT